MAETWPEYLERIAAHSAEGAIARAVWTAAVQTVPGLPTPRAAYSPEEDPAAHIAWGAGDLHVDIDVMRGGAIEWFYRNRATGECDGSDGPEAAAPLPAKFVERLTLVASLHKRSEP